MRIVLGLDPGLAKVGYGAIRCEGPRYHHVTHGVIRTDASDSPGARLACIHAGIVRILEQLRPEGAGVESLFLTRNTRSAMQVAEARGVLILTLAEAGVPYREYTPSQIKRSILMRGSGDAQKGQVQQMIRLMLGMDEVASPHDAADALATAICFANDVLPGMVLRTAEAPKGADREARAAGAGE